MTESSEEFFLLFFSILDFTFLYNMFVKESLDPEPDDFSPFNDNETQNMFKATFHGFSSSLSFSIIVFSNWYPESTISRQLVYKGLVLTLEYGLEKCRSPNNFLILMENSEGQSFWQTKKFKVRIIRKKREIRKRQKEKLGGGVRGGKDSQRVKVHLSPPNY